MAAGPNQASLPGRDRPPPYRRAIRSRPASGHCSSSRAQAASDSGRRRRALSADGEGGLWPLPAQTSRVLAASAAIDLGERPRREPVRSSHILLGESPRLGWTAAVVSSPFAGSTELTSGARRGRRSAGRSSRGWHGLIGHRLDVSAHGVRSARRPPLRPGWRGERVVPRSTEELGRDGRQIATSTPIEEIRQDPEGEAEREEGEAGPEASRVITGLPVGGRRCPRFSPLARAPGRR